MFAKLIDPKVTRAGLKGRCFLKLKSVLLEVGYIEKWPKFANLKSKVPHLKFRVMWDRVYHIVPDLSNGAFWSVFVIHKLPPNRRPVKTSELLCSYIVYLLRNCLQMACSFQKVLNDPCIPFNVVIIVLVFVLVYFILSVCPFRLWLLKTLT